MSKFGWAKGEIAFDEPKANKKRTAKKTAKKRASNKGKKK